MADTDAARETLLRRRDDLRALDRLDQGGYGMCVRCGNAIGEERLELLPDTVLCASCAQGGAPGRFIAQS